MSSKMSIDEKMKLVQKLREKQMRIQGESIQEQDTREQASTLGFRILLATVLFIGFAYFYKKNEPFYGITATQIYNTVEENTYANLFDFIDEIPYTLK